MATLDNEKSGQQVNDSKEFICIFCTTGFWVYARENYEGGIPSQTIMCPQCLIKIKNVMSQFNQLDNM